MGSLVLDVSNQNPIDLWRLQESEAVALIAKATEGSGYKDVTFQSHRNIAAKRKIPFGSYLFLHPDAPGDEADFYLAYAKPKPGDVQPIIDAEVTDGEPMAKVAHRVDSCAQVLEAKGYRPILYASADFWKQLFAERPDLKRLRVWEADYPGRFTRWLPGLAKLRIRLLNGASVVMWQWTDAYAVAGKNYDASRLMCPLWQILVPLRPQV
jgi:GH25 family lysozyme M1 (1,4-beta-N-acetylmuramidase)